MRARDFAGGRTWVLGVQSFDCAVFLCRRRSAPGRRPRWRWTDNLLAAETFPTRDDAARSLESDPGIADEVGRTMPDAERGRLRPLRVEIRVGV